MTDHLILARAEIATATDKMDEMGFCIPANSLQLAIAHALIDLAETMREVRDDQTEVRDYIEHIQGHLWDALVTPLLDMATSQRELIAAIAKARGQT